MSAFQLGIVTFGEDMLTMLKADDIASEVLRPAPSRYHCIKDFIKEKALNLKGTHLVRRNTGEWVIEEIALKEILWASQDEHGAYGLYKEKTLIFNGPSSTGKTQFAMGLASEFASRMDKQVFGWGTICNFGAVTKADRMKDVGCFVFDDFDLTTRGGNHNLSKEEKKHLLFVAQAGNVAAFYATAVFPAGTPRLWCVNYRHETQKASFVHDNFVSGLAHLSQCDASKFNGPQSDQHDVAIARRAVIFDVSEALFERSEEAAPLYSELAALETNATPCPF